MKITLAVLCGLILLAGCEVKGHLASKPNPVPSPVETKPIKQEQHQSKKKYEPETREEWIAEQNAKNEPCKVEDTLSGWISSSSNGYDTESSYCRDGRVVYEDTTKETQRIEAERWAEQVELIQAARSRVLTPKEMKRLLDYGPEIFTRPMQQYFQADIEKSFDELLLQQARLKAVTVPSEPK